MHRSLNILFKKIHTTQVKSKSKTKFIKNNITRSKSNKSNKAIILFHIKLAGIIKCLRILSFPSNKHEAKSRTALLCIPPNTIHLFYSNNKTPNMSWVYEYGRLDLTYCGVSKIPMQRIWQHICCSRFAHHGSKHVASHYSRVANINGDSMYALTPLCFCRNMVREHVEDVFVSELNFTLNYCNTISHKHISSKPNPSSLGMECRFKAKRPGDTLIPQLNSLRPFDFYHYTYKFSKDISEDISHVKLDDLLLTVCKKKQHITIHIQSGHHDATDWCAIDMLFGDTTVTCNGSRNTVKLRNIKALIHRNLITTIKVTDFQCDAVFATSKLTFAKIIHSLKNCSHTSRVAKLYTCTSLCDKLHNPHSKKQAINCVKRAFKHFNIKIPPKCLFIRTQYNMSVSMKAFARSARYIVGATDLPASAQRVILDNTSLVKKPPRTVGDICTNSIKWSSKWSLHSPWEHSSQCISGTYPTRDTYGCPCMAFRADEYFGIHSNAVKCNLHCVPSPDRQAVFHSIVTGLLNYQDCLCRFTTTNVSKIKIKQLASECNHHRPISTLDNKRRSYTSTREINDMVSHFDDCVLSSLDKNTRMLFVCCKHFYWQLLYKTFEFAATGAPSRGLNYVEADCTPDEYVMEKRGLHIPLGTHCYLQVQQIHRLRRQGC